MLADAMTTSHTPSARECSVLERERKSMRFIIFICTVHVFYITFIECQIAPTRECAAADTIGAGVEGRPRKRWWR
jgi:hypothetical protein